MKFRIPTAEELLKQEQFYAVTSGDEYEIAQAMIEFAKLHVEAALKQASEKAYFRDFNDYVCRSDENKRSILNSYVLENIK